MQVFKVFFKRVSATKETWRGTVEPMVTIIVPEGRLVAADDVELSTVEKKAIEHLISSATDYGYALATMPEIYRIETANDVEIYSFMAWDAKETVH